MISFSAHQITQLDAQALSRRIRRWMMDKADRDIPEESLAAVIGDLRDRGVLEEEQDPLVMALAVLAIATLSPEVSAARMVAYFDQTRDPDSRLFYLQLLLDKRQIVPFGAIWKI